MVAAVRIAAVLCLALGLVVLALVPAARAGAASDPPGPWASVNVCDTADHPNGIGVRASMPGTGDRRDTLVMRFVLQYRRADGRWARVGRAGDSGFVVVGHGGARTRQAGRTFTVMPPRAGRPAYLLRAVVTFEWRRGETVVRRARRLTQGGRGDTAGADPAGFSAATCAVR